MTVATHTTVALRLQERSQVGDARRMATTMANSLGFTETDVGKVSIIVTEAAGNLLKHAEKGEMLLHPIQQDGVAGMEILSLDKGRGMADVERCMQDGYSTAGSPGTGLGAMARLAHEFEIHSQPQIGTSILIRLWAAPRLHRSLPRLGVGGVSVPVDGEHRCGDAWAVSQTESRTLLMIADGLGHGQYAADAAEEAVRVFTEHASAKPTEILELAHGALRATRGAAMAVAEIGHEHVLFAGIGNIAATVVSGTSTRSMISHNGIVGHQMRPPKELSYPWTPSSLLVMHSDGLQTKWNLSHCPGLERHTPTVISSVLYRDFRRDRDDVTVVTCKEML